MGSLTGNTSPGRAASPLAVPVLCAVQFVDVMGGTVVVTALPRIVGELGGGSATATGVVTGYAVAFGGLLMVAARWGDRVGHRRALLLAVAGFCAASALAALAPSAWVLVVARVLQGAAAAVSVPAALRLLTTAAPEGPVRRRALAGWSAAGAAAGASGFAVGGVLTELATWRAAFAVMLGLGVLLVVAVVAVVPAAGADDGPRPVVPWWTGAALAVAVAALVGGATLVGEPQGLGAGLVALASAVVAAAVFLLLERRGGEPLVPRSAVRSSAVRWGTVASFANTATTSSTVTLATLYLQDRLGLAPLATASLLLPFSLLVVAGAAAAPRLVATLGWGRSAAAGLLVVAAGNALLAAVPTAAGAAAASATCGLGLGVASVAATDLGTHVVTSARSAAAGLLNTAAQTGTAVGTAAALLVAGLATSQVAWVALAVVAACAATALGWRAPARPREDAAWPATRV